MTATEAAATTPGTATPKLNKALSQLQGELPQIKKTKTAKIKYKDQNGEWKSHEYSYADLGDVVADVGPLLAKHGLAFHCAPTINPGDRREMLLYWSLLHESGEQKTGEWPLGPVSQKPQALGSAITYGRRYCFTAATNIVLDDDDDGQRAQQEHDGRQSAGDMWDQAVPARPAGGGRVTQQQEQPADGENGSDWYQQARTEAGRFTTKDAGDKLFVDAASAVRGGLCSGRQKDHIQNLVRQRQERLRTATPVDVEVLARQAAEVSPAQDETSADPEPGEPSTEHGTVTRAQITAIWTVLTSVYQFGKDEKDQARAVCAHIARRPLESTTHMSRKEASDVLDTLASWRETAARHEEDPRAFLIEVLATAERAGQDAAP